MPAFINLDLATKRLKSFVRWPEKQKTVGQYCELFKKACEISPEEGSKVLTQFVDEIYLKRQKYSLQEAFERSVKILAFIEFKTIDKTPDDFSPAQRDAIKHAKKFLMN